MELHRYGHVRLRVPAGRKLASVDELARDADLFLKQKNPPDPFFPFDKKEDMASTFRGEHRPRTTTPTVTRTR